MLSNFLRVAIRSFLRQRLYSVINVVGLSSGLVCTLFIFLWVRDEVQKDKFHDDSEKIFHIVSNLELGDGKLTTWPITPGPLEEDLREHTPEAELIARTMDNGPQLFQYEEKDFLEKGIFADPDFFKIFNYKILKGVVKPARLDKSWVAISQKLANRLFGDQDPIGKSIGVNKQDLEVTAVFDDVTSQSSIQFEFVLPFELERERRGDGFTWGNFDYPLYVKLTDPSRAQEVITKVNQRAAKNDHLEGVSFFIQPFTDYYLNSNFDNGKPAGGRIKYVQIFSIVAVFILAIACINFMNMATAKAANRVKEVGVRKVVGAQRLSLIIQFMSESLLISFLSMVLALVFVYSSLPLFNLLVAKHIELNFGEPFIILSLAAIVIVTGLLAGSYPAFFLSSFHPARILKGTLSSSFGGAGLRKSLVVFQFTLTVILVASALIVYKQMEYIRGKDVGYNRESVLSFSARGSISRSFEVFKNEALQNPAIKLVSRSNSTLVQVNNQNGSVSWQGKADNDQQLFRTVVVDYDFLETMGLKLLQGRLFSKSHSDTTSFVVTRRAAESMGMKDPIGQEIVQWGNKGVIVGVVDDFHSRSLHEAIDPVVFMCRPEWTGRVFVRFDGNSGARAIEHLQTLYKKYSPEYPFEYSFLDDDFERLYNNEKITSTLALGFTMMAIVISSLGLLGLASYTTERKRKEISIRKTLGATVSMLVASMSKDFIQLSLLAAILGCPIAYYLMSRFLEGYAYHVQLGWDLFALTALVMIIISLTTVIFQVTKAAIANPVDALRNE